MSLGRAGNNGSGRVAVVGAPTVEGARLRAALAEFGVPGERVDLYGSAGAAGEVLLSEYAGEARMIQEPDLEEISEHSVIFICEEGEIAERVAAAARPEAFVIDLLDCLLPRRQSPRIHPDINPERAADVAGGRFVVPHPLALLLAELLVPLDRAYGLVEAVAVVLRPASDFGDPGLEELRQQTVRLLSCSEVPVETFGRQLAFNVIPQRKLASAEASLESRIVSGITEMLGWKEDRVAIKLLTAPLFYGHGLQLRFRLEGAASPAEVRQVLREGGFVENAEEDAPATPLEVAGEIRTSLAEVSDDGLGGYWLWVVAGENAARGARQAVRLAARLGGI